MPANTSDDKSRSNFEPYSEEISLSASAEIEEYVHLNLRKIAAHRKKFHIPVIGIAGTEGKTTTKRMLASILSPRGKLLETPLNCTTTSGITSTLLKLDESYKFAILELSILNRKQFEQAVKVSQPTIGVVTNIGESHLATLGDKYLIADAKVELVRNLPATGYAVLNVDDDLVSAMEKYSGTTRIVKFGLNTNAHFFANRIEYCGPDGIKFRVNDYYEFHLPIYSSAYVYNVLAAISVARILDISFDEIKERLEKDFSLMEHRGNLISKNSVYILDNTYDATINSVPKAYESLVQFKRFSKKLVLVIGDISNPGPDPIQAHLNIGFYLSALPIDTVITVGSLSQYIAQGIKKINNSKKQIIECADSEKLEEKILASIIPGTTILMIGKKELNLSQSLKRLLQQL